MESYNDVLIQCHLSLILLYNYTLYIRAHDERRMLMSRSFVDFYSGWIHIEHQVEVRLMRLQIMKLHDAVELVHQLIWNTQTDCFHQQQMELN